MCKMRVRLTLTSCTRNRALHDEYWYMPDYSNVRPNSREAFSETVRATNVQMTHDIWNVR